MNPSSQSPSRIIETAMSFMASRTLLSAAELGVFTALGDRALTGEQLRAALGLHSRANPDFFDALVAMRFLDREGAGPEARYRNTPESSRFLDRSSAHYIGGFLEMVGSRLFRFWGDLNEALETGRPQNELKHAGGAAGMFDALYADPARLEQFLEAMAGISTANFEAFAEKFDFSRYTTLCDVGGATGRLCMVAARRHPHLRCTTTDLPAVTPIARKRIAAAGLADRIDVVELDFFAEPLPRSDVLTMGMILHDWNLERKMHLIRAAYDALPDGGAFVAIEHMIDDERRENVFGLLMSLNMLIEFGDSFDFTAQDFFGWCRAAGFRRMEKIPLSDVASAGVAYK